MVAQQSRRCIDRPVALVWGGYRKKSRKAQTAAQSGIREGGDRHDMVDVFDQVDEVEVCDDTLLNSTRYQRGMDHPGA